MLGFIASHILLKSDTILFSYTPFLYNKKNAQIKVRKSDDLLGVIAYYSIVKPNISDFIIILHHSICFCKSFAVKFFPQEQPLSFAVSLLLVKGGDAPLALKSPTDLESKIVPY